jgi:hypothetical protein
MKPSAMMTTRSAKPKSPAAIALLKKAPTPDAILTAFNPQRQTKFTESLEKVFDDQTTPSLALLKEAYGKRLAESWLEIQINDVSEFSGVKWKLEPERTEELARMMLKQFPRLTLAQFMLFFQKLKACEYGKFYSGVDPMVIMGSLREYYGWLCREIDDMRCRRRRIEDAEANRRLDSEKDSYRRRVPNAFTPAATIDWTVYCVLDLEHASDSQLRAALRRIADRTLILPPLEEIVQMSRPQFNNLRNQLLSEP